MLDQIDHGLPDEPDDDDHDHDHGGTGRRPVPERPRGRGSSMLMAAMLGLADGMGFDRPKVEIVAEAAASPTDDDGPSLGFGPLDPLD